MKNKKVNILSLFDGMSNGQIAVNNLGANIGDYYASEVDQFAISVTKKNYPNTKFIGDVRNIDVSKLNKIDLIIGGSPCQGFSFSGTRKGARTKCDVKITTLKQYLKFKSQGFEFEGESYLFWEYIRIYREVKKINPDVKFLLENVNMEKEWRKIFNREVGQEPYNINSNIVSAQNRNRFYWTDIDVDLTELKDLEIYWDSIQIDNADDVCYYTDTAKAWLQANPLRRKRYKLYTKKDKVKMQMVEANHYKGYSNQRCFAILDANGKERYIHPIECERLQTVPDDYTAFGININGKVVKITRSQRYKMLGNGWTVKVIEFLLSDFFK